MQNTHNKQSMQNSSFLHAGNWLLLLAALSSGTSFATPTHPYAYNTPTP